MYKFLPAIAALTIAPACASSTMVVKSDHDRNVNFEDYRSFYVAEEAGAVNVLATDGYDVGFVGGEVAPDLKRVAINALVDGFEKKGLRRTTESDEASIIVTFLVNVGAKPEVIAPDYRVDSWSGENELGSAPVARGTLVVDVLDPNLSEQSRSFLVWRGWATDQLDPDSNAPRGSKIKEAMDKIIARYPN